MVSRRRRFSRWWRRTGMAMRIALVIALMVLFGLLSYGQQTRDESGYASGGLLVHVLVNLNIAVVCLLGFLIGRNIVKLVFDRRRNILGARLRTKLVVAFVGLILVPTVLLFWLASGLLNRALEGWFSTQVEAAVDGAIDVGRLHYKQLKSHLASITVPLERELTTGLERGTVTIRNTEQLAVFLEHLRTERELFSVRLLDSRGEELASAASPAASIELLAEPPLDLAAVSRAVRGESSVFLEEKDAGQFIRAYTPTRSRELRMVLVSTHRIDPDLTHALAQVTDSYKEYQQLKLFKSPLKSGYLLTLTLITGLIIFAAVWFAFYLARELVGPIQRLAEGLRAVARGNLEYQVREGGDDEVGFLIQSFNQMTHELKGSRSDAEHRRAYLEAVLSNLDVGVIALDEQGIITAVNKSAGMLFGRNEGSATLLSQMSGRPLSEVVDRQVFEQISPMVQGLQNPASGVDGDQALEREISVLVQGKILKVICTAGPIADPTAGRSRGMVLIFDDITELAKAQHMSAWREVARRVAHEIKNPLTPIQLSAQRIERSLRDSMPPDRLRECTQTIVENVTSIKRLADEFSKFARMPAPEFSMANLNVLISETLAPYAESCDDIALQFIADTKLPEVSLDTEQIRRVIINLVDNAIAAVRSETPADRGGERGRVVVRSAYQRSLQLAIIEVADNGPGIPTERRTRIFEPYFTTKTEGTGLGLAIVSSIIGDHHGEVRMYSNSPRGARFVVELPLSHAPFQHRRSHTLRGDDDR